MTAGSKPSVVGVRKKRKSRKDRWTEFAVSAAVLVVVLAVLEWGLPAMGVQTFILPTPSMIFKQLAKDLTSARFWGHVGTTGREVMWGWLVGSASGFLLGVVLTQWRLVEAALTPYIIALQAVPKVALAPVIILALGYGEVSKIAIAAIVAFFPVLVNVMVGIRSADQDQLEMMRSFGASRVQTLRWAQLPGAMPSIMAGLEVAAVLAIVGAIVGEFTGASAGLGFLILQRNFAMDQAGVFSTLIVLSALGVLLDALIRAIGKRVVRWREAGVVVGA